MRRFLLVMMFPLLVSAVNTMAVEIADARVEVYRTASETDLKLWIFGESDPTHPKPAIVFFFGGGWNGGTPKQFEKQARHFAERGMIAMVADYRVKKRQGTAPVECVKDGKAAVAWIRTHAERLGIDPARIAAAGASAGGHVAACTGTLSGFGSDERPNALILFNPVTTLANLGAWEARGFGTGPAAAHLGVEAPEALSPAHHIGPHTPPTLIFHGDADTTVPLDSVRVFVAEMKRLDRPCELIVYEGASHGFFNRGEPYNQTLAEADRYLVSLGWLGEP